MKPPLPILTQDNRLAYKIGEAAALLGVSQITVRRAIQRGLLHPCRAFRHVLIQRAELERFLQTTTSADADRSI